MRLDRPIAVLFTAALLCTASSAALAGPTAKEKAEAKQLVTKGKAALKQKRWVDAEDALRRADELDPSTQTKTDLARALSGEGRLVEASRMLHEIVDPPSGPKASHGKKSADAKKLLGEIEARIPWLQVTVKGPGPGKAQVQLDGIAFDAANEAQADPGDHTVSADADGFEHQEKKVTLGDGEHVKVALTLTAKAPEPAPPAEPVAVEEKKSSGGSKLPAVIAFGAGAVGLGIGIAFGIMAFNEESKANDMKADFEKTGDKASKDAFDDSLSTSKTDGTVSTVGFVVGGVGVAAGVILLLTAGSSSSDTPEPSKESDKVSVRPWIGPGQAGLIGRF